MRLSDERILVVGCGSVGSWVAYCLISLGYDGDLTIVDHDVVSTHNVGGQFIGRSPGESKVNGFLKAVESVIKPSKVKIMEGRIEDVWHSVVPPTLMISAVDSIETRRFLAHRSYGRRFVDFRISPTKGTIIYVPPMTTPEYLESLNVDFAREECGIHSFLPVTWATVGVGISHLIQGGPTNKRIDISPKVARTFVPTNNTDTRGIDGSIYSPDYHSLREYSTLRSPQEEGIVRGDSRVRTEA